MRDIIITLNVVGISILAALVLGWLFTLLFAALESKPPQPQDEELDEW